MKKMDESLLTGVSFGLISGVITTIGTMVGLNASTNSKFVVLTGIFSIGIADAMSDSLGIHVSEESTTKSVKKIWTATFSTFLTKIIIASTFAVPIFLFEHSTAIMISIFWGIFLIALFSYFIAKKQGTNSTNAITEHVLITIIVILVTYLSGRLVEFLNRNYFHFI